jgi:hypothetical protein
MSEQVLKHYCPACGQREDDGFDVLCSAGNREKLHGKCEAERQAYIQGAKDALEWVTQKARSRMYKQPDLAEYGVATKMLQDAIEAGEWPAKETS